MSWDAFQREAMTELGLVPWQVQRPGQQPPPPADPRVLAWLAKALRVSPGVIDAAGIALPPLERLRDPAVKRALWPQLRGLRRRP